MTDYIKDIISIVENLDDDYEYDNIKELNNYVYDNLIFIYPEFNKELFKKTMNKLLKLKYVIDRNRFIPIHNLDKIEIPENQNELVEHVEYIANLPQPEQRTEEWFKMRENMLTASTAAQIIGKNPYPKQKPEDLILEKVFGKEFIDNEYVHHGKKYEEIATMIYENIYNIKVNEYGLIPHPDYKFLGASPDGIATYKTLDNKFSNMIGRMLEIKCPYTRKIKVKGKVNGGICPHYYWCQVQQQLECCDLDKCDFWQCSIVEYDNRNEWLKDDTTDKINTEEQNQEKLLLNTCRKGCIIQLQPKDIKFDEFKSVYIYPEEVDMTCAEYEQWVLEIISDFHNSKYYKDYVFDRILYWKLVKSHNVVIERDTKWFEENLPKYNELWDRIKFYRANPKEAEKLKNKVNPPRKKFISSSESDGEYDDDEA